MPCTRTWDDATKVADEHPRHAEGKLMMAAISATEATSGTGRLGCRCSDVTRRPFGSGRIQEHFDYYLQWKRDRRTRALHPACTTCNSWLCRLSRAVDGKCHRAPCGACGRLDSFTDAVDENGHLVADLSDIAQEVDASAWLRPSPTPINSR